MTVVPTKKGNGEAVVDAPDGGWGWMVVFGSFMIHVIADGQAYSYGVYVNSLLTEFDASRSAVGFLGSLMLGVTWGCGPIASMLVNKYGCRVVAIVGTIVAAFGFIISIFAPNIYFMYISFGIIGGFGLGLAYLPAIVAVSFYFEKRRSFATGLAVCGSGIGTFIYAPLTDILVQEYGWRGCLLIETGLLLNCIICGAVFRPIVISKTAKKTTSESSLKVPPSPAAIANSQLLFAGNGKNTTLGASCSSLAYSRSPHLMGEVLEDRLSPSHTSINRIALSTSQRSINHFSQGHEEAFHPIDSPNNSPIYKPHVEIHHRSAVSITQVIDNPGAEEESGNACSRLMDCTLMLEVCFVLFFVSNFLTSIGLTVPYVFLPDRAQKMELSSSQGAKLLSVVGITNTIGRILFGYLADFKWINRLMLYNTALAVCGICSMLSALCFTYTLLAIYSGIFGLLMGVYICLTPIVLVDLVGLERLSNAFGIVLLAQGIGTVIGAPIAGAVYDATQDYNNSFYLMGVCIFVSGAMLYPIPAIQRFQSNRAAKKASEFEKQTEFGQTYIRSSGTEQSQMLQVS